MQDGRRIYDLQVDSVGDAFAKSDIAFRRNTSGSFKLETIKRLGLSSIFAREIIKVDLMKEVINLSLGNELMLGIAGLRRVEVKPQKGIKYKIT